MKFVVFGVVALAAFVVLVHWRAHQREARAEAAYPPIGQILDVGGTKVHAHVVGTGPDLVLLHGASGNMRDLTFSFVDALSDRYRVILFDRPGLGWTGQLSDNIDGAWGSRAENPKQQAALLRAAARQLNVKNPIVVGHSFGGAVAWAWGLTAPDETAAIVSIAGVANPWPGKLSALTRTNGSTLGGALIIPLLTGFAPEKMIDSAVAEIFAPDQAPKGYLGHVGSELTLRRKTMRANARQVNGLRPHIVEMSAQYERLTMPVEIVHGDVDTIVPLDIHSAPLPRQMPAANLTVLPGAGHMPHHTHQAEVLGAIDRAATRAGLR